MMNFNIVKTAAEYVRKLGLEDNFEHLVAVDAKGNILFCTHGDENSVEAEGYDFKDVAYIVHNHPNDSSLSPQDVVMSNFHNCTTVAVSRSGSMYASSGLYPEKLKEKFPKEDSEGLLGYALGGLEQTDEKVATGLILTQLATSFRADISVFASHIGNLVFSQQGFMNYEFQLSDQDRLMYENNKEYLGSLNDIISLT